MPKITRIQAYRVELPLHEGSYKWSGGNSVEVFDSTVVAIHTDAGVTGYGEVCPLGPAYLPAYAEGARAGIAKLAPQLDRPGSHRSERAERLHGCGTARPSLREIGAGYGVLGHSREDRRTATGDAAGRPLRRNFSAVPRHLAGEPRSDGGEGGAVSVRRLHQIPAQSRRRSGYGYRAHPAAWRRGWSAATC